MATNLDLHHSKTKRKKNRTEAAIKNDFFLFEKTQTKKKQEKMNLK